MLFTQLLHTTLNFPKVVPGQCREQMMLDLIVQSSCRHKARWQMLNAKSQLATVVSIQEILPCAALDFMVHAILLHPRLNAAKVT